MAIYPYYSTTTINKDVLTASTFKAVSLVAAANAGYDLNTTYDCPGEYQVGTRAFQNFESKAQGRLSMKKAMAISCDTIWYKIAFAEWLKDGGLRPKANPNDYFFKAAEGFQIGKKTGIDLPSESSGRLANREWRKSWYEENKDFYCNYKERATKEQQTAFLIELARENCLDGDKIRAGDAVNFSIGQGDTVISPLKLVQMYAAIGNGGTIWKPTVGKAIVTTDGKVIQTIDPVKLGTLPASKILQSKRASAANGCSRNFLSEGRKRHRDCPLLKALPSLCSGTKLPKTRRILQIKTLSSC